MNVGISNRIITCSSHSKVLFIAFRLWGKMFCLNLIVLVGLLHCNVLAIRNGEGAVKIERYFSRACFVFERRNKSPIFLLFVFCCRLFFRRRQSQSFFPREDSANPNFAPSPSDVYFTDTNAIQEQQQTLQFSNNIREDLHQQYSPYQQQPQQQRQQPQQQQQPYQLQQFNAGEYVPLSQQQQQ